jgi:hypothetical protein
MKHWRTIWIIAANSALLYGLLQLGAFVGLHIYDTVTRWGQPSLSAAEQANYAHMTEADRDDLLRSTLALRFRYEPVLGFVMEETASRFVNIDSRSIRSNGDAGARALDASIWFIGGSTTLGVGVADVETIPAQLERLVGRPVVNLGVSNFAAAEENLLLGRHLRMGLRPASVIFLDGINETCWPDLYDEEMSRLVRRAQREYAWDPGGPARYAFDRAVRKSRRLLGFEPAARERVIFSCQRDGAVTSLEAMHARRLAERAATCALYQVSCHTIVQPFAGVHGKTDAFSQGFLQGDAVDLRLLFERLTPGWRDAGAVFLTDALDRYDRHAFVDQVHYSADASRVIADSIARRVTLH